MLPAIAAVSSLRGLPATAASTAVRRLGTHDTAPTTMRALPMLLPSGLIADATLTSGETHPYRSRASSKQDPAAAHADGRPTGAGSAYSGCTATRCRRASTDCGSPARLRAPPPASAGRIFL